VTVALVAGALANKAGNAGAAWTRLSWVGGLRRLGFDVHLVEQLAPGLDKRAERWFASVVTAAGLAERATLLRADGTTAFGLTHTDMCEVAGEAPLLVNLSGHLADAALFKRVGTRVYVDLDPGYTQVWHAQGLAPLRPHDHWYTVGTLVGTAACAIPDGGLPWRAIRQPVVLDDWPAQAPAGFDRLTTVGAWRGPYGLVEIGGEVLGAKLHEFRRFLQVPIIAPGTFELALGIDEADGKDRAALEEHGWRLVDTAEVAADPDAFRAYVQGSSAEFSVAQAVYARTTSGWFSDRTTRYLASGRPALVQDTGFSRELSTGEGLIAFTTVDEANRGAESIAANYDAHCRAARAIAEEHFAAEGVLGRLCEEVGVAP
jgi:hypothetical protein